MAEAVRAGVGAGRPVGKFVGAADAADACATLIVENMNCGGCLSKVERKLGETPGVHAVRGNLSAKRVTVRYDETATDERRLIDALASAGYRAADIADVPEDAAVARERDLLKRIGVAGFAAANIMLLSVSVWAGVASDMGPGVQGVFHWVSALIAMPAIAYAGQPFFASAFAAIKARNLNMDVPISVAICLATAMSLFQTTRGSEQVYFDAGITLLFFLLIGRFLDQRVRVQAAGAAQNLMAMKAQWATVIEQDGSTAQYPARALLPGMRVLVAAGERMPVDGTVVKGRSDVDESLITGETAPKPLDVGATAYAGTVNLTGPIEITATATEDRTLLAEIGRLIENAEQSKGRYVRLADRAARLYAPAVHLLGLATFLGWLAAGYGWEAGLTAAIAVLIITCPCALALAVPAVQVAAASRLFKKGIIIKSPDGLERMAEVDTVVLDKTGTLTVGKPQLEAAETVEPDTLRRAARLAAASSHPYARALLRAASERLGPIPVADGVVEQPGLGLSRIDGETECRLGSAAFLGLTAADPTVPLWYREGRGEAQGFRFADRLRPDAPAVVGRLQGFAVELLSGDRIARAQDAAVLAGITVWHGEQKPADKIARLETLKQQGRKVLMVGDGLNDAPALAAGHASLSPSTAADISQTASDAIFQGEALGPLTELVGVAQQTRRMALQNFAIALGYNAVCVPLAMAGFVTPLIAALAMSTSSVVVTLNALRLATHPCPIRSPRS